MVPDAEADNRADAANPVGTDRPRRRAHPGSRRTPTIEASPSPLRPDIREQQCERSMKMRLETCKSPSCGGLSLATEPNLAESMRCIGQQVLPICTHWKTMSQSRIWNPPVANGMLGRSLQTR